MQRRVRAKSLCFWERAVASGPKCLDVRRRPAARYVSCVTGLGVTLAADCIRVRLSKLSARTEAGLPVLRVGVVECLVTGEHGVMKHGNRLALY